MWEWTKEEARSITAIGCSKVADEFTTRARGYTFPKAAAGNIERLARMKEMVFLWKSSNEKHSWNVKQVHALRI